MRLILRAVFAVVLMLCAAGTSLAGDLQKQFSLSGVSGSRESVQFDVAMHHDNIVIEAEWTGQATDLALMLNGPGRTSYYARKDGKSVLRVEYKVAQADIAKGKTWVATIANFSNKGPANGTMRIWYPDRRAVIDSITPARGKHGDILTIKGEGFSNVDEVGLGNANRGGLAEFRLNIKSRTPDTIEAVVAGPAGSHKVVVTSLDRQSYAQSNGTLAVFFEPMKDTGSKPPPPMTGKTPADAGPYSFSPAGGKPGDTITIKGVGFGAVTEVRLGGLLNIKSKTSDTIEAVVAGPVGHYRVKLMTNSGMEIVLPQSFQVLQRGAPAPMIGTTKEAPAAVVVSSFSPIGCSNGKIITIKGVGFGSVTEVRLGESRLNIKRKTSDTIEAEVSGPEGSHKVNLVSSLGVASSSEDFTVFPEPLHPWPSR